MKPAGAGVSAGATPKRLAPCLVLSVYARGGNPDVRDGIVAAHEDYVRRWGENVRWFADGETERFRKFDQKVARYPRRALERGRDRDIRWVAYGGEDWRDAGAWKFKATIRVEAPGSALDVASASWGLGPGSPAPQDVLDVALDWARRFPVLHGYAGYSLGVSEANEQATASDVYDLAMRFHGLEIHAPRNTANCCMLKVKSVNWLTLVANELLTPRYPGPLIGHVGDAAVLREKLPPEVVLHPIRDGVLIQAGPEPLLGDVNRGETLPLYREVAKVLKPIRAETHWPFFGILTANDWMTRFDR